MGDKKQLYIVISQTGTILSRILKLFTGAEYNHASVSLTSTLSQMYSFGRKHPYNPFFGGFVIESTKWGTFKRFYKTRAVVLAVNIDEALYAEICEHLNKMSLTRKNYHYNYLGVLCAAFHIRLKMNNYFYCSEFVKYVLQKGHIEGAEQLPDIIHPIHFFNLPHKQLYCGRLNEYNCDLINIQC